MEDRSGHSNRLRDPTFAGFADISSVGAGFLRALGGVVAMLGQSIRSAFAKPVGMNGDRLFYLGGILMLLIKRPTYALRAIYIFAFAACLSLVVGLSFGAATNGDYLGKTRVEIAKNLREQRYRVQEFETENGVIEVEGAIDGVSYEIHVDPKTGEIVSIEIDD
jgi:hypothetical protein